MIGAGDDPMKILALVLGLIGVAAVVRKLARGEAVRRLSRAWKFE